MVLIRDMEVNNVQDVEKLLCEIAETTDDFIYADEYDYSWSCPEDWDDFHDFFCDEFDDEEYKEFEQFVQKQIDNNVDFPSVDEPEDPNQAGWDAWYSSRGC